MLLPLHPHPAPALPSTGWSRLADPVDPAAMLTAMAQQLALDASQPTRPPLYGDGHGAGAIVCDCFQDLGLAMVNPFQA